MPFWHASVHPVTLSCEMRGLKPHFRPPLRLTSVVLVCVGSLFMALEVGACEGHMAVEGYMCLAHLGLCSISACSYKTLGCPCS